MINRSTPKTSPQEFHKTSAQKKLWNIISRHIIPTIDDQVNSKETQHSPWFKTSEIKLRTCLRKKTYSPLIAIISLTRYLIFSYNINAAPVEPNWMMRIPSPYYICKSDITLEEGMANWVTIVWFHWALSYECLDWMIWK